MVCNPGMEPSRSSLPIVAHVPCPATPVDVRDAGNGPVIEPLRPPKGAPNVLLILIDDMGFGAASPFGGPCQMPTAQRLADNGLRFSRFHTTALCSPTRAALLTGRNHHSVGMGAITELATAWPGYNSIRPASAAPIAEVLKLNGYNTACFGKWHQTPVWETSATGPFDRWPTGEGFERFFGFSGGETDQPRDDGGDDKPADRLGPYSMLGQHADRVGAGAEERRMAERHDARVSEREVERDCKQHGDQQFSAEAEITRK